MNKSYGYGYPSWVKDAHGAHLYDQSQFTKELYARTARANAEHAEAMANARVARRAMHNAPPPSGSVSGSRGAPQNGRGRLFLFICALALLGGMLVHSYHGALPGTAPSAGITHTGTARPILRRQ